MNGADLPGRAARLCLLILAFAPGLLLAQERPSIHMLELEAHRDVIVDYARADSIAATMPPPLLRVIAPTREIVGYLPYWLYDSYTNLDYNLLTQINYFSVELDGNGNITNDRGWPRTELVNFAHAQGVRVKLCATLLDWANAGIKIAELLSSASNRQRAIVNLLAEVQAAGADGVDIDFEPMPADQKANMVTFMRALTDTFHTNIPGSIVTLAMPAVDWSDRWDYNALAQIVDGLFIMGYDYHWSSGLTAGPSSPLAGFSRDVTWTVDDYLTKTEGNAAKIILGLPYYGYDWPVESSGKYAATSGSASSRFYSVAYDMAQTHGRQWDETSSTPWFNYQSDGFRQVWYDDSLSLSLKYDLALEKDLAGVGMWALGYDGSRPELWGALADHFTTTVVPPPRPTTLAAVNNGDGTVLISVSGIAAVSYQLLTSTNGVDFSLFQEYQTSAFQVIGLPADSLVICTPSTPMSFRMPTSLVPLTSPGRT